MTNLTVEDAARELVRAIYGDPAVPGEPRESFLGPPTVVTERQSYRNGYYSVRDLPEFKRLQALLRENVTQEAIPPGEYVCKIDGVAIEPGRKPGDLKLMLTVDIPERGAKLRVEAASCEGSFISEAAARELTQCITARLVKENAFLYPNPQVYMIDPYALLDLIRDRAKLPPEKIDAWMVEAQGDKKPNA